MCRATFRHGLLEKSLSVFCVFLDSKGLTEILTGCPQEYPAPNFRSFLIIRNVALRLHRLHHEHSEDGCWNDVRDRQHETPQGLDHNVPIGLRPEPVEQEAICLHGERQQHYPPPPPRENITKIHSAQKSVTTLIPSGVI